MSGACRSQVARVGGMRALCGESLLLFAGTENLTRCRSTMDLLMLTVVNSNERDLDMWRELFNKADPNFTFLGASQPKGCRMWTIEAVWDPDKEFSEKDALPGALF